ncbi:MAG: tetratricopeptide repeat protein [Pontiellaceae bacterium]|nr:tetratricopeptide repeat protein [Pontiellaceae bacterium]
MKSSRTFILLSGLATLFIQSVSGELQGFGEEISNREVRVQLARLYAEQPDRLEDSYRMYRALLEISEADADLVNEFYAVCLKLGRAEEALQFIDALMVETGDAGTSEQRLQRAHLLRLQHNTIGTLQELLSIDPFALSEEQKINWAQQLEGFGAFYRAEPIYRSLQGRAGLLPLAKLLISTGRYERADELIANHFDGGVAWQLVQLKSWSAQKRFTEAVALANTLRAQYPASADVLNACADILFSAGDFEAAAEQYQQLDSDRRLAALLGQIRCARKMGDERLAQDLLQDALVEFPEELDLEFEQMLLTDTDVFEALMNAATEPDRLLRLSSLCLEAGAFADAVRCTDLLVERYPNYLEGRFAQAEINGIAGNWDVAVELADELLKTFPAHYKLLLLKSRVLAWSENYEAAVESYAQLHQLNPSDPVPIRERARTFFWAKKRDEGAAAFEEILSPSVSRRLSDALAPYREYFPEAFDRLNDMLEDHRVWEGYETFAADWSEQSDAAPPEIAGAVDRILAELTANYRIQKGVDLELQSFILTWNKRFTQALKVNQELIALEPGNQEALFNLAQLQCLLGLCDDAAETYETLIRLDPSHSWAQAALAKAEIDAGPSLRLDADWWSEEGRGALSAMDRLRLDLTLTAPVQCRYQPYLRLSRWLEDARGAPTESASGLSIGFDAAVNPWLKGRGELVYKDYENPSYEDYLLGEIELWGNVNDWAWVGVGFQRREEIPNRFALAQQIQMDQFWVGAQSALTHWLDAELYARSKSYDDDNSGMEYAGSLGWRLTDHPRELKLIFSGEYRDTEKDNVYQYVGPNLVDITHPYWTPQNYFGGTVLLDWRHDLARPMFCGTYQHYYEIKVGYGIGSDGNGGWMAEAEWFYEFKERWGTGLRGYVNESKEWDANGLHAFLSYRF